jgi:hypothetical protein
MKKIAILALGVISLAAVAQQQVQRDGYVKKNGTYVAPHTATKANDTKLDNYSTKGNVNPTTGKAGTVDPYKPKK